MSDVLQERLEQRDDLVVFLSKLTDEDLEKNSLEEILESRFIALMKADEPFTLSGE